MIVQPSTAVNLQIPQSLVALGMTPQRVQGKWLEWAVIELFREETVSSGKAAQLLGISRESFIRLLSERGVPYLDQSMEELVSEIATLQSLGI